MFLQALCMKCAFTKRATSVKKMSDATLSCEALRTSRVEDRARALRARAREAVVSGLVLPSRFESARRSLRLVCSVLVNRYSIGSF
jgi:hypothetical protein